MVNGEDNKDRTLPALGLVCGGRAYDLRGDGVAEDMILLTCCLNTSAPELPAVWCLENGKRVIRPPLRIEGPYKGLAVVVRPTSKTTTSFEPRTIFRVVVPERVCCSMVVQGVCICITLLRVPSEAGRNWSRVASEELAGVLIRVYAHT